MGPTHVFIISWGAHHLVAVVQREHKLLEVPACVLLTQPLSAPQHRNAESQRLLNAKGAADAHNAIMPNAHTAHSCKEAYAEETWSKRLPPEAYSMTIPRYLSVKIHLQTAGKSSHLPPSVLGSLLENEDAAVACLHMGCLGARTS